MSGIPSEDTLLHNSGPSRRFCVAPMMDWSDGFVNIENPNSF